MALDYWRGKRNGGPRILIYPRGILLLDQCQTNLINASLPRKQDNHDYKSIKEQQQEQNDSAERTGQNKYQCPKKIVINYTFILFSLHIYA
jgi:hypothetical protein